MHSPALVTKTTLPVGYTLPLLASLALVVPLVELIQLIHLYFGRVLLRRGDLLPSLSARQVALEDLVDGLFESISKVGSRKIATHTEV